LIEDLVPILLLHGSLLPLNLFRLHEILKIVGEIREAGAGDLAMDALLPFMTRRRFKAGEILCRKGDLSHEMFYLREGVVRLAEIGKTVGQSDMLGEISMFSPSRERTATAVCETDGELLRMSDDQGAAALLSESALRVLHRAVDHASTDRELRDVRFRAVASRGGTPGTESLREPA
jgi:CRP-like cAMP-binding protein